MLHFNQEPSGPSTSWSSPFVGVTFNFGWRARVSWKKEDFFLLPTIVI
jgi:hypothetical protein